MNLGEKAFSFAAPLAVGETAVKQRQRYGAEKRPDQSSGSVCRLQQEPETPNLLATKQKEPCRRLESNAIRASSPQAGESGTPAEFERLDTSQCNPPDPALPARRAGRSWGLGGSDTIPRASGACDWGRTCPRAVTPSGLHVAFGEPLASPTPREATSSCVKRGDTFQPYGTWHLRMGWQINGSLKPLSCEWRMPRTSARPTSQSSFSVFSSRQLDSSTSPSLVSSSRAGMFFCNLQMPHFAGNNLSFRTRTSCRNASPSTMGRVEKEGLGRQHYFPPFHVSTAFDSDLLGTDLQDNSKWDKMLVTTDQIPHVFIGLVISNGNVPLNQ